MIEKIENILILISRYFLIIIGALALVSSILVLFYSLSLIADKPNLPSDKIDSPMYDDFQGSLFPKKSVISEPSIINSKTDIGSSKSAKEELSPVDQIYKDLKFAISLQFNDSQEMIDKFSSNITPRSLNNFISSQYLSNMPYKFRDNAVISLVDLFNSIENINDFKKIGSFDSRLDLITKLIDNYFESFNNSIQQKEYQKTRAINKSIANNTSGYAYLINVFYALAIYAAAVLYLMIFKVEIDLRKISPAIKNEDN